LSGVYRFSGKIRRFSPAADDSAAETRPNPQNFPFSETFADSPGPKPPRKRPSAPSDPLKMRDFPVFTPRKRAIIYIYTVMPHERRSKNRELFHGAEL